LVGLWVPTLRRGIEGRRTASGTREKTQTQA
jgi:hypothetical protein